MNFLNRNLTQALDAELMDFKNIDKQIAIAESAENNRIDLDLEACLTQSVTLNSFELRIFNLKVRKQTIARFFLSLDESENYIAFLRWSKEMSWEEIAAELHYSEASIRRRKNILLRKYAELKGLL